MRKPTIHISYEDRQSIHQALLSGSFWFAWAIGCYQAIYLQSIGFQASKLGILNAISSCVAILAMSFWGTVSDKTGSVKRVALVLLATSSLVYCLVPALHEWITTLLWPYYLLIPVVTFFRTPVSTFHENLIVRNCNELSLNYGRIRSIGSLLYAICGFYVSHHLTRIGIANTFWIYALFTIIPLVLTLTSRDPEGAMKMNKRSKGLDVRPLFRSHRYVLFLVFTVFFYVAANFEASFLPFFMSERGIDTANYGGMLALRALCEMPFLLLMSRLRRRMKLHTMLVFAPLFMGIECLGFGLFVRDYPSMLLFAAFFGMGNGCMIGSSLNYVYEIAPEELKASAQAYFAATAQVAAILGNLVGGFLFEAIGSQWFYLLAGGLYLLSILVLFMGNLPFRKQREAF